MPLRYIAVALRYIAVVLLFALCGAVSAWFLVPAARIDKPAPLFPFPFIILCALLCLPLRRRSIGTIGLMIGSIILMFVTWGIAQGLASIVPPLGGPFRPFIMPCVVGGFIGGLGLFLSASICYPRFLLLQYLSGCLGGVLLGSVSGLAFVPWLHDCFDHLYSSASMPLLVQGVAVWQAAVGTYLYAICNYMDKPQPEESRSA